jgi:hypothetical protein
LQALFQSAQHMFKKWKGDEAGSGSVPLTNGSRSGSVRPKNMQILQTRNPNTLQYIKKFLERGGQSF